MGYVNVGEFVVRNDGAATHTEQDPFSIFHSILVINNNVFLYGQPLAELNYKHCYHKMDQDVMLKGFID
jgi:hypothetical protein